MIRTIKVEIDGGNPDIQREQVVQLLQRAAARIERGDDSFYLWVKNRIVGEVVISYDDCPNS